MEDFIGLECDEAYELDSEFFGDGNVQLEFVLPEIETCDPPNQQDQAISKVSAFEYKLRLSE